jgi:uncharacterized protein (TIGR00251 family)
LQTGSKKNAIGELYGNRLRIRINARPVAGKANRQLIAYLAGEFEVKKSDVVILSGLHSRDKTVCISHCNEYPPWLSILGDKKPGDKNSVNK